MSKMKTLIIIVNLGFIVALFFAFDRGRFEETWEKSKYSNSSYIVPGIAFPTDLEVVNNSLYILKDSSLINWDIDKREITAVTEIEPSTILDSEEDQLYTCSWENYEISSPEEYSTVITWRHKNKIMEIPMNRTVRPIRCLKDKIIATNALPTLQEKYYKIIIADNSFLEVDFEAGLIKSRQKKASIDQKGQITINATKKNLLLKRLQLLFKEYLSF